MKEKRFIIIVMKSSNMNFQKKYSGMYVLTEKPDGKVVAFSRRLDKAFEEAEKKGYHLPAVQHVPPYGTIVIYNAKISIRI